MRILVAGGAGYVGSVLVPQLFERGYYVDVIDLLWFGNHLPDYVNVIQKNIITLNEKDLSGYDQVIFIAGLSNDPMAEFSPARNFIDNAAVPAYLSYTAKQAGVRRFIYASSCSVYGYKSDELCYETAVTASQYPYGISKLQGEFACLSLSDDKFSVISLRKGTISGYSPRMRMDLIINTMFRTAIMEHVINISNPSIWRPILDIRDAAVAYIRAIEADEQVSGIFNIAYGNYTVGEVGDLVKETIENSMGIPISLKIDNKVDYRNYKVSTEKARTVLSFNPRFNVKSIVENLVEHINDVKDMSNPNYYNIIAFKKLQTENRLSHFEEI